MVVHYGFRGWLKKHLFSDVWNTLLTIAVFSLLYLLMKPFLEWSVIKAVWVASTRRECLEISPDGACWAGVIQWFNNLIYGRYPNDLQWRINLGFGLGLVWLMPLALKRFKHKIAIGIMAIVLYPFLADYLFLGGDRSRGHYILACVALAYLLTVYINIFLIYTGHRQLGQYLEPVLERVSPKKSGFLKPPDLPAGGESFGYIHFSRRPFEACLHRPVGRPVSDHHHFRFLPSLWHCRSVFFWPWEGVPACRSSSGFQLRPSNWCDRFPMITVLFMSVTMMPLFFPNTMDLNKLAQVIIAVCIFAGAYMAETVRGGLQSIARGQFDAAKSVGTGVLADDVPHYSAPGIESHDSKYRYIVYQHV